MRNVRFAGVASVLAAVVALALSACDKPLAKPDPSSSPTSAHGQQPNPGPATTAPSLLELLQEAYGRYSDPVMGSDPKRCRGAVSDYNNLIGKLPETQRRKHGLPRALSINDC